MSGVFDDFMPSLPKILVEIDNLRLQDLSVHDAIREIARIIFSNSNLYYVYAKTIQGQELVANCAFCKEKTELEIFESNYPKKMQIDRSHPIAIDIWVAVNGKPRIGTQEVKRDTFFDSPIFRDAFSFVAFPLSISSNIIGVINMASNDIVEEYLPDRREEATIQLHTNSLELLMSKINEVLNSVENGNHP
jgi:hypothetical protein